MATTLTIAPEYGYVLLTASLTTLNAFWHGGRISAFRKAAGLSYPTPYADSAHLSAASTDPSKKQALYLFNCAQRAHGNFLENQTTLLTTMLVSGVQYPLVAAGLGLVWNLGRVVYAVGYTRADQSNGKGRLVGSFFWFAQLGLIGLTGWTGGKIAGLV
ncbi:Microsomal glutathione S-transferase 3 [Sphaceloma murrayae]|uniref:Microsomal glutathione S-transferase 3 n=1 Tax=Sphaceloma murrayae TaxID=2082308 RepID=A0A2K1QQY3_9PEZI|nr:Microsomal glutathione S-transferase 3 [Sphaceloma murrayae]